MKQSIALLLPVALLFGGCAATDVAPSKAIDPVDFSNVLIQDSFWAPRLDRHKTATIPVCIDQSENQTGRIRNFEKVAAGEGEHEGYFFDDSDVYKAMEGFAYSLIQHPDPELEAKCDEWIDKFAAAQQPNGYLDTYYTLAHPGEEWTDMDKHELYCAGHMLEAAIAYYQATGKDKFLGIARRVVDNAMSIFGPDGRHWVPGHEEIELALCKLYRLTGEEKYLNFADWLLQQRGHGYGVYGGSSDPDGWWLKYYQDQQPVTELRDIYGHAVRAMYLYCGMADVASYTHNQEYLTALDSLWDDVVLRNMYITGGIGQSAYNEGITEDYDLPNEPAYCETCASVGMVLWNARMNQMKGDAKYADVLERSLYNGMLAGVSLSGDRFFYVNPLESYGNRKRQAWFGCACCPSNICRVLPSLGGYIYGTSADAIYVNLYIGSTAEFNVNGKKVKITQETNYPWDGAVCVTLGKATKAGLRLRVPGWCKDVAFTLDGKVINPEIVNGYAVIDGRLKAGTKVCMTMDMPVEVVAADPRVKADVGKRAICRGPLVYCAEQVDNPDFDSLEICAGAHFKQTYEPDLLGGVVAISSCCGTKLVPYYSWCNREQGKMKVWLDYTE